MIEKTNVTQNRNWWILAIILFTSVDTILFGTNGNRIMNYVPRIVSIIGILFLLPRYIKKDKNLYVCVTMLTIVILSNLLNGSDTATLVSRFLFILLAYAIVSSNEMTSFFRVFDWFMYIISIFALMIELLAYVLPGILSHFFIITNTSGLQFYSCGFGSIIARYIGTTSLIRASGIFWEPGAFSIYLVIALMVQLFILKFTNLRRLVVYLVCLVLTFSTTGMIAGAMLFFTFTFSGKIKGKSNSIIRGMSVIAIVFSIMFMIFGQESPMHQLLFGKIINSESTARTRYASFIVPFGILLDYPLLGVGGGKIGDFMRSYAHRFGDWLQASNMCTNTLSYQFGAYGLIFGLLFVIGTWKFCKNISFGKKTITLGLFLTFFLAYFGENFFSFFSYVFVFYGFSNLCLSYKGDNQYEQKGELCE